LFLNVPVVFSENALYALEVGFFVANRKHMYN